MPLRFKFSLGAELILSPSDRRRLAQARGRVGEIVTLTDASGESFRGRVLAISGEQVRVFVFEALGGPVESGLDLILLQALPDKERMELIIQKATELGADVIVPFHSIHSIRLSEREQKQKKAHRWPSIALAAAKQCRRERVPTVAEVTDLAGAMAWAEKCEVKIAVWEKEKEMSLRAALKQAQKPASAALLVGPEGGLEEEEIEQLKQGGFIIASLGRRILRTETAAIAGLTIIQYAWGDLGEADSDPSRSQGKP
jgi:16S rRNA (uracil1498-N3)-methyltransferase